jgi:hypothetical protein
VSTTARLGLPAVSSCERQRNSEYVCRAMLGHASMDGAPVRQQTRGGSLTRPRVAERGLSGTVGVTGVGERPHVRAREQACGLKNDPTLALLGGKTPRRMAPRLAAAKRRRAQLGRGTEKKGVGVFVLPGKRMRMRGCTDVWIGARVRACTCRGHGHGDGRDNVGDATTGKDKPRNEEERMASEDGNDTCKKRFPSLARWPASHSACEVAQRRSGHDVPAPGSMAGLHRGEE